MAAGSPVYTFCAACSGIITGPAPNSCATCGQNTGSSGKLCLKCHSLHVTRSGRFSFHVFEELPKPPPAELCPLHPKMPKSFRCLAPECYAAFCCQQCISTTHESHSCVLYEHIAGSSVKIFSAADEDGNTSSTDDAERAAPFVPPSLDALLTSIKGFESFASALDTRYAATSSMRQMRVCGVLMQLASARTSAALRANETKALQNRSKYNHAVVPAGPVVAAVAVGSVLAVLRALDEGGSTEETSTVSSTWMRVGRRKRRAR
jgi:hypothetical protein